MATPPATDDAFPHPPRTFVDGEDREITVEASDDVQDGLLSMYADFAPEDRSQGIPPREEDRLQAWVVDLFEDGVNVLARHGDRVVGHAVLLPFDDRAELAIFVTREYQSAGIGSALLRALLGEGSDAGIERVWLSVARSNAAAVSLYRSVGFETTARGLELEMELVLGDAAVDGSR